MRIAVLTALTLAGGYTALVADHDAIAAVLLCVAYVALVPWAIMVAGRSRPAAVDGRARAR